MSSELEIHVIGAGIGESIVVGVRAHRIWGVIDSYNSSPDKLDGNATVQLLENIGVDRLDFVALTHPHYDHYTGLLNLLERFDVNEFWMFDGISPKQLGTMVRALDDPGYSRDFAKLLKRVHPKFHTIKTAASNTILFDRLGLKITCLAPSGNDKHLYQEKVGACFNNGFDAEKAKNVPHNLISNAYLLEYGGRKVLLGGDVESGGWEQCIETFGNHLCSSVVKASHHGSVNGYCNTLWNILSPTKEAVACVTPFQSSNLPRKEGAQHILGSTARALLTAQPVSSAINLDRALSLQEKQALLMKFHCISSERLIPDVPYMNTVTFRISGEGDLRISHGLGVVEMKDVVDSL